MTDTSELIDYYAILNLPHSATVTGVENAYTRLSSEFAVHAESDPEGEEAFRRLNEAYNVLSRADLRKQYDSVFLAEERRLEEQAERASDRMRGVTRLAIKAVIAAIVMVEAGALLYIARDDIYRVF